MQNVRELAHELWKQRGCPIGDPITDWLKAESIINGKSTQPFQASRPTKTSRRKKVTAS